MPRPPRFTVIGENIHTTRALSKTGGRVRGLQDGSEGIRYRNAKGKTRYLRIPEAYRKKRDYEEGRVKHFQIAVQHGAWGEGEDRRQGVEFIHYEALRQVEAGADYLDLNVDEVSMRPEEQQAAMRWLVPVVQAVSPVPPSIDSSNVETIQAGLQAYDGRAGRPMLNSAALERPDALDLVRRFDCKVVLTAAGRSGMPDDSAERVANVREMVDLAEAKGVPKADIHIDALVFPVAVDVRYGGHYLDAVRQIRQVWGEEVHITGGLSNVSFGLPERRLINAAFIAMAVAAGADGAIMDPVLNPVDEVFGLDTHTGAYRFAHGILTGQDSFCEQYIEAWREGKLKVF